MKNVEMIAQTIVTRMGVVNMTIDMEEYKNNKRWNPFFSELNGMFQILKMMEIDFEITFDDEYKYTGIVIDGAEYTV